MDINYTKENRRRCSSVQKNIDVPQLQLVGNDAIRSQAHDDGKDLRRARYSQAVVRIVIETASAWSIERLWHEDRDIIPSVWIKQAMTMQAEAELANARRFCRVKETSRAKYIWHDERQPDSDSAEQQSSVQDMTG